MGQTATNRNLIGGQIGSDGMAAVYTCLDALLGRPVALKVFARPVGTEVEDPLAFCAAEVRQRGVGLVIVDPLHALLRSGDINDYSRVNEAIKPLVEVARTGLHLLFVHHMGKRERSGDDRVLGSTALFGAVDALITMAREQGVFVVESIQRYGTDLEPTAVRRDKRTGLVTAIGPVEEGKDGPTREAILEYLGDGERTEDEIRAALGRDQGSVGRALRKLMRSTDPRRGPSRSGGGRKGDPFRYRPDGGGDRRRGGRVGADLRACPCSPRIRKRATRNRGGCRTLN